LERSPDFPEIQNAMAAKVEERGVQTSVWIVEPLNVGPVRCASISNGIVRELGIRNQLLLTGK
jgi:hypothetical protein